MAAEAFALSAPDAFSKRAPNMPSRTIEVRGAREHNLAGVDVSLPRNSLTVVTGVSGSGKSSLAFDTIYKEGQRRFVESLSAYARQFLGQMDKPRVELVEGLSPTVSIDQKTVNRNPRSTVGTVTEIYDHFRLLFARLGEPRCPECGRAIRGQSPGEIAERILALGAQLEDEDGEGVKHYGIVLAPIVSDRKGEYRRELEGLEGEGFVRVRVDGEIRRLDEEIVLDRYKRHTIEVIIDRVALSRGRRARLVEAIELALKRTGGEVRALVADSVHTFSALRACPDHDFELPEVEPRLFSFNSPHGACTACNGIGWKRRVDPGLIVPDPSLSIADGAFANLDKDGKLLYTSYHLSDLEVVAEHLGVSLNDPFGKFPAKVRKAFLQGTGKVELEFDVAWEGKGKKVTGVVHRPFLGVVRSMEHFLKWAGGGDWSNVKRFLSEGPCNACDGTRLRPVARAVWFRGRSIADVVADSVDDADRWIAGIELHDGRESLIGPEIVKEIRTRLRFLRDVGLSYLSLDRPTGSLSGGEAQRIRLARQVGSGLRGVLYVLDEPSVGLHARDNRRLLSTLGALRDQGNTVLVVEHDEETMRAADHIVDVGPGAGAAGGRVVASGTFKQIRRSRSSLTADYLAGRRQIAVPAQRRSPRGKSLLVRKPRQHNLKGMDVEFPLGCFVAVTGVSGSGKSTLVDQILFRSLRRILHDAYVAPGEHGGIDNIKEVDKVIRIDQSPIGRTPRSNPATYTKLFTEIRSLFSRVPDSKIRGYKPGRFSFNVAGGRCEYCKGAGVRQVEMQFLATVSVPCDECDGKRFNRETLEVRYRGRNVFEVLDMTISEAIAVFGDVPKIRRILQTLVDVGLGYMKLGQPSTTISGGEAQRVKLASELHRPSTGNTFYILDEPTTGLHFVDVERLIVALQRLVDAGNTVVVIEHNTDVIKVADWLIDMGPEGGDGGGYLVASGSPESVARESEGATALLLRQVLGFEPAREPAVERRTSRGRAGKDAELVVRGARTHNLKGIDVRIPHDKMTVITGLSGSGKSSLAFETIFAEGQRRFVESLSTYARRFLGRLDKPPVDAMEGLAPAIAIDQGTASRSPRSTVATTTELHDYLRILWARVGRPHCERCGGEMRAHFPTTAAREMVALAEGRRLYVTVPLFDPDRPERFEFRSTAELGDSRDRLQAEGYLRVLVGTEEQRLDEEFSVDLSMPQPIAAIIDRIVVRPDRQRRIAEAFERAFHITGGIAHGRVFPDASAGEICREYSTRPGCGPCGKFMEAELTPRMFSFNSHQGACKRCAGLGISRRPDPRRIIAKPDKPLLASLHGAPAFVLRRRSGTLGALLRQVTKENKINMRTPWRSLDAAHQQLILGGDPGRTYKVRRSRRSRGARRNYTYEMAWDGLIALILRWHGNSSGGRWTRSLEEVMVEGPCPGCDGLRLRRDMLSVTIDGRNIMEVGAMTVRECQDWFERLALSDVEEEIAREVRKECLGRLRFLLDVGLGYLALDRRASTLSGGEAQRIRLASQIGHRLVGVIYVLDEPTVGLHPRDTDRLLATLRQLRDLGNTLVVVEHDRETIECADHVIDLGPGAGEAGGYVSASGPPASLSSVDASITGAFLAGRRKIQWPSERRAGDGGAIEVIGARIHNLDGVDVRIPTGAVSVVSGVSGSGKSSLVMATLRPALRWILDHPDSSAVEARQAAEEWRAKVAILGPGRSRRVSSRSSAMRKLAVIDQAPIGRTPKSNPATYSGVMTPIRELFSTVPLARQRGYKPGRFSFNGAEGRCRACEGAGANLVEMHFLSDVWVTCDECRGRRYNDETLEIRFKGASIADVLKMHVVDALKLFQNQRRIRRVLETMDRVGLGYVRLGQSGTTLSGGEAQRLKLATELARVQTGDTVYLLDEPTTGLHLADIEKLLNVIHELAAAGNTVVLIEHHPDVMMAADHMVDMGPEAGDQGGRVVACGTPECIASSGTHTGKALRKLLENRSRGEAAVKRARGRQKGNRRRAPRGSGD